MKDDEDFPAHMTARDKYDMEEKPLTESILERVEKAAERLRMENERRANAKEYAFSCYKCWKHGTRFLEVRDQGVEGPEQFVFTCWKCKSHPKKKYASLKQVEKFDCAYPKLDILGLRTPPPVWPPEPRKPVVQNEASRFYFEKMFGKD